MSWLGRLFKGAGKPAGRKYVMDGRSLLQPREGRIQPRDIFGLLNRISRFAEREKVEIRVVFEGEPLNRAPDGKEVSGVSVFYEKTADACKTRILRLVKESRDRVTVITQDPDLDRHVLAAGGDVLSTGTFRKVLDAGAGVEEGRDRVQDPGRRRRGGRRPRSGGGGGGGGGGRGGPQAPRENGSAPDSEKRSPAADNAQGGESDGPAVRDLIDLVE